MFAMESWGSIGEDELFCRKVFKNRVTSYNRIYFLRLEVKLIFSMIWLNAVWMDLPLLTNFSWMKSTPSLTQIPLLRAWRTFRYFFRTVAFFKLIPFRWFLVKVQLLQPKSEDRLRKFSRKNRRRVSRRKQPSRISRKSPLRFVHPAYRSFSKWLQTLIFLILDRKDGS